MVFTHFRGKSPVVFECGFLCAFLGGAFILTGNENCQPQNHNEYRQIFPHDAEIVTLEAEPVDFKLGHYFAIRYLDSSVR